MRTLKLLFTLLFLSGSVVAQIKVESTGQVEINPASKLIPAIKVTPTGQVEINPASKSIPAMKITPTGQIDFNSASTSIPAIKLNTTGQVQINGGAGSFSSQTPKVFINSVSATMDGINSGLSIFNINKTANNWVRLNFATTKSDNTEEDFVSLGVQYKDRTIGNESSDFHIATYNRGNWASRFAMYSARNYVQFYFNAGSGGGLWIDNSGGEVTIHSGNSNYGYLGTNDSYWYKLYVNYAYYNNHAAITSDKRAKNSIRDIDEGTMQKLNRVRGVKYKINVEKLEKAQSLIKQENILYENEKRSKAALQEDTVYITKRMKELQKAKEKDYFGFIAQELIEIFPEVVEYDEENDSYGVQYTALIPIMIEGMKEQQAIIEAQSLKLKELESKISGEIKINEKVINTKSSDILEINSNATNVITNAFLYQNVPNPFSLNTEIKYYIPQEAKNAALFIFNIQGKLIKTEKISKMGNGGIVIGGAELSSGMYIYTLVVDGQEVDSKKMILTE